MGILLLRQRRPNLQANEHRSLSVHPSQTSDLCRLRKLRHLHHNPRFQGQTPNLRLPRSNGQARAPLGRSRHSESLRNLWRHATHLPKRINDTRTNRSRLDTRPSFWLAALRAERSKKERRHASPHQPPGAQNQIHLPHPRRPRPRET